MKKLFLALAIFGFITFGAIGVQNLMASSFSIEMVDFDKDPKKDGDKKSKDDKATKEMKAETTSTAKDGCCASPCTTKASSSCCSKSGDADSKGCPDKK